MHVIRARRPSVTTRLALLLVAVACGVVFTSLSPVSSRTASAQTTVEDKFVYYTLDANVFVANADGTGVTALGPGHGPAWSPDAQKIVFANSPDGPETSLIYSMKADGAERTRLSDGYQDFQPSYSPDGSQIVFVSQRPDPTFPPGDDMGHTYRLFVMDADGGNERKLFASGLRAEHVPAFSPDGARIAFVGMALSATGTSEYNVYVVNADGTDMRRVTNYEGFQLDPNDPVAFSRDGKRIVYTHGRDLKSASVEVPGEPLTLTNTINRDEFGPTFSPEGTKLAYFANDFNDNAADGIYIMDTASLSVVFTGINGRNPRWMPRPVVEPTPTPTPTPAPASADLSVSLTASPNPGVGRDLTYTMRVDNHGPDAATAVSLNFVPPVGVNFVSAETTQGQCSTAPGSTQCLLGDIASGASATVKILTVPTVAGEVTALSTVSSAVDDPAQNNNAQPLTINISATCVPEVTGEVAARVIRNGNQSRKQLKHTIVAQNTSGRRLHGLVHFVFEGIDESVSGDKKLILRESRCLQPLGTRYASVGVGNSTELVWEPNQIITFEVDLYNPERVPVGYNLRIYTGPGYP